MPGQILALVSTPLPDERDDTPSRWIKHQIPTGQEADEQEIGSYNRQMVR
jgi:hypothetical protein